MKTVVLPLCAEARIPDKTPLHVALNGTPFSIREGETVPKDGDEPTYETCYLTTLVGTWHVRAGAETVAKSLTEIWEPLVVGSISAESISAGSVTPGKIPTGAA